MTEADFVAIASAAQKITDVLEEIRGANVYSDELCNGIEISMARMIASWSKV